MFGARILHRRRSSEHVLRRIEKLCAGERELSIALPAREQYETGMRRNVTLDWWCAAATGV
jgi:hypothetical protein